MLSCGIKEISSRGLSGAQETGTWAGPRRVGPGAQASGGGSGDAAAGAGAGAGAASGQLQLTDVSDCCKWCEASPVVLRCSRCLLVKYCDDDCQRQDWKKHKPHCITKEEQARRKGLSEELCWASRRGDVRAMNALAAQGADINYAWVEKRVLTPLMAAVCGAEFATIDALIVAGVRVNAADADGYSALCIACIFGAGKADQDLARQAGMTCESTSVRLVKTLIAAGSNVNHVVSSTGVSPLFLASQLDHPSVVDALIKAGANVNHARPDGMTALIFASQFGSVEIVRLLLAVGADPRPAASNDLTALSLAKHFNHPAVVALLEARLAELAGSA